MREVRQRLWSNKASLRCPSTLGPREKPCEDVWEGGVKKVSKLPQGVTGPASNRATDEQRIVTTGTPEHGNHLRLRALASDDVQAQVEKYLSTIHHQQSAQLVDISGVDRRKVTELRKLDRSANGLLVQRRNLKMVRKTVTPGSNQQERKYTGVQKSRPEGAICF